MALETRLIEDIEAFVNMAVGSKNANVQIQDEGVNLGSPGTVDTIDFVGAGVTASRASNKVTVTIAGGGGVSDGDKGDITVSSSGTVWTIDNGVVDTNNLGGDITTAGKALLDDANAAAQRTTLGLGTAAVEASGAFAAASHSHAQSDITSLVSDLAGKAATSHTHAASDITSGTVATARLGSGTADATTFLRGDQSWVTPTGGSGDVTGPGSATDNAIARFNGTGGKTLQNSAVTVDDDGIITSTINSGACATRTPLTCWVMLTADYTLTSTTSEQKAFNTTTNGTLTLPTGVYEFECFLYLSSMSDTSGNLAFDPIGAGTAVTDRWGQHAVGVDNGSPLAVNARNGSASVTQQTPASAVTATAGAGFVGLFNGMFRISTGGTIIPSVTLVTAAAAIVKAGSWFRIRKVGESSETYVGAWT